MDFSWIRYLGRRMHYSKFSQKYHFKTFSFNYIEVNLRKTLCCYRFSNNRIAFTKNHMKKKYLPVNRNLHQNHFYLHCKCYKLNRNAFTAKLHHFKYHLGPGMQKYAEKEFIVFKSLRIKNWAHLYCAVLAYFELRDHQKPKGITVHLREDFVRNHQHSPSSLTTRGTFSSSSRQALVIPLAIMAQFTIPPKMFTSIASTCREETECEFFNIFLLNIGKICKPG